LSISELCVVGKPCILIPSPNVSEDHQTKNASVLSQAGAALLIADNQAVKKLKDAVFELVNDEKRCGEMRVNLKKLALPNAAKTIADEVIKLMKNNLGLNHGCENVQSDDLALKPQNVSCTDVACNVSGFPIERRCTQRLYTALIPVETRHATSLQIKKNINNQLKINKIL